MKKLQKTQIFTICALAASLLLPLLMATIAEAGAWHVFFVASLFGLSSLFLLWREHEKRHLRKLTSRKESKNLAELERGKRAVKELRFEMDRKSDEMRRAYLEFEDLRQESERVQNEYRLYQEEVQSQFDQKEVILKEYQQTIVEQRTVIEKKQRYVAKLEGKVNDLMYEIRSLLEIHDTPKKAQHPIIPPVEEFVVNRSPQPTHFDLSTQLSRYVERAENLTGADHLGPRFSDLTSGSMAIDLRRLFDHLRDESSGIVLVYSPMEQKFLFVNPFVKTLLGYSPEKFMKNFRSIVEMGLHDWADSLKQGEGHTRVVLRDRSGEEALFDSRIQSVTKGPFAGLVLGMFVEEKTA